MKDILQTRSGATWREVLTVAEAMHIGLETHAAYGFFFEADQKLGPRNQYFALGENFAVIGCVPLSGPPYSGSPAHGMPLFVAHANGNPFPQFAQEIVELAAVLGAEISPSHYPYRGDPDTHPNLPSPDGP